MKNLIFRAILILFISSCGSIYSQVDPELSEQQQKVVVKMKNGEEYSGEIVSRDNETVVLRTVNGEIRLIASNIRSIENYEYKGKFKFPNPHDTRYFFAPSGIPLGKGGGYYQNVLLSTNFVNYGLTQNFSIGGGFEFISTILGYPVWFLTPKVGFQLSENVHAAGGILVAGLADIGVAALPYGVFTYGSSESNISLGAGYGLVDGEFSSHPAVMVGGTHRVSNSIALLTENYLLPVDDEGIQYMGVQGIRILSRRNAFDVGLIIGSGISSEIPALPFVGYALAF